MAIDKIAEKIREKHGSYAAIGKKLDMPKEHAWLLLNGKTSLARHLQVFVKLKKLSGLSWSAIGKLIEKI